MNLVNKAENVKGLRLFRNDFAPRKLSNIVVIVRCILLVLTYEP